MKPTMLDTAYLVTTTRTAYGDYSAGAETKLACRWRFNLSIDDSSNEQYVSDAMAWFNPDADVVVGSIIKYEGSHYKVQRVVEGKDMDSGVVEFLKTELDRYGAIS